MKEGEFIFVQMLSHLPSAVSKQFCQRMFTIRSRMNLRLGFICYVALLLFLLKSTIVDVISFFGIFQDAMKLKEIEETLYDSLKKTSPDKVKGNFVKTLKGFMIVTEDLCNIWKSSAFSKSKEFRAMNPCSIIQQLLFIEKQLRSESNLDSIIKVFENRLQNDSYIFVDTIIAMESTNPETIPVLLQDVNFNSKDFEDE